MALKLANGKGLVVYNFWKMANKKWRLYGKGKKMEGVIIR